MRLRDNHTTSAAAAAAKRFTNDLTCYSQDSRQGCWCMKTLLSLSLYLFVLRHRALASVSQRHIHLLQFSGKISCSM